MIYVEWQCNECFIVERKYVLDVNATVSQHIPRGWTVDDEHVPVCSMHNDPNMIHIGDELT
jgi:hypothetical protein